jgi:hypothetical protein
LTHVLMIARIVSGATTATTWPPRAIRVTCTAGRQFSSPLRMTNAPTGRVAMAKPLPEPWPWLCGSWLCGSWPPRLRPCHGLGWPG